VTNTTSIANSIANNQWLSTPNRTAQAQLQLFCFPFAGGGTAAYFPWSKLLPPEVALCSIRLPARESRMREKPYTQMAPLVQDLANVLAPYLDRPFAFFGHSLGALIAFEMARYLRREKMAQPLHLFASGHRAPQLPDPDSPLYLLPDDEFVREMSRRYNGVPKEILQSSELLNLFLPVMRADATVLDTYVYSDEPPLAFPISAYSGDRDHSVRQNEMEGWHLQTQGPFQFTMFAGDHFFVRSNQAQVVQTLSKELAPYLGPAK
jgi:medium-chain acyl-[acyl-carrier-protein] hydrolase